MRFGLSAASAALVFVSGNALAGVIVTSTHIDVASNKATPSTIYAESDRMKVVSSDTTVIFRGDLNKAWVITPEKRTYMELTPETMRMFGGQIAGAQAQFNAAQAQLEADVCIAPIASTGLTVADFRVLESFASFIAPVASSPVTTHDDYMNWNDMNKAIGFQGVPLDTTRYAGGRPTRQETVQKIERATIPANTFDLPPGLTKQDAPNIR
jgi:hypothetical protein